MNNGIVIIILWCIVALIFTPFILYYIAKIIFKVSVFIHNTKIKVRVYLSVRKAINIMKRIAKDNKGTSTADEINKILSKYNEK